MGTLTYVEVDGQHEPLMFELFASVKGGELEMEGWAPEVRSSILRFQYEAQRSGYRSECPEGVRSLILHDGVAVGWVIVDRAGVALRGIDIAFLPDERCKGLGTKVIRQLQAEAASAGRPFVIEVQRTNVRAIALYFRLGFRVAGENQTHLSMEWRGE